MNETGQSARNHAVRFVGLLFPKVKLVFFSKTYVAYIIQSSY